MSQSVILNEIASDFCLTDTRGNDIRLSDYKGKRNILLVFNRGYACPFCRRHMSNLQKDYPAFIERETEIITLGPNSAKDYQRFWSAQDIPFIGCADIGNQVAKTYFQEFNLLKLGWVPALFVLDKNQIIRFKHYGRNMADIPENQDILDVIDQINGTSSRNETH
jgi:peroxiredoxin